MLANVRVGSWPRKNSNARRARRNILEKLRIIRTDAAADIPLGAALENCIFYICPMYEFLHSLGHSRRFCPIWATSVLPPNSNRLEDVAGGPVGAKMAAR